MSQKETGAVRSADSDQLDFTSLPIIGLFGVARTAKEGATKYARLNYMKGFPVHDILNHALIHVYMFLAGDRSEPNLEHAAWGLLAAVQQQTLDPEHSSPHLLGPGATLTTDNLNYLAEQEAVLGPRRAAGEFAGIGDWKLSDVPQIARILDQRFCPCDHCSEPYAPDARLGSQETKSMPAIKHPNATNVDPYAVSNQSRQDQCNLDVKKYLEEQEWLKTHRFPKKITPASEGGDHMGGCPPL